MSKIYISFMTDEAIETLKRNQSKVTEYLKTEKENSEWLSNIYSGNLYIQKKYTINEFSLKLAETPEDYSKEVAYDNAITLYEALKDLPAYVLTDERFWAWINFGYCYKAAQQAMPIKSKSTFYNHWVFGAGQRRGVFFGVFSREFYRVALSVDENADDPYEYTRFVYANPERIRHLTWRANSNNKKLALNAIKAEKKVYEECAEDPFMSDVFKQAEKGQFSIYSELAKFISLYGSVRLIDALSEDEIVEAVYEEMMRYLRESIAN